MQMLGTSNWGQCGHCVELGRPGGSRGGWVGRGGGRWRINHGRAARPVIVFGARRARREMTPFPRHLPAPRPGADIELRRRLQ